MADALIEIRDLSRTRGAFTLRIPSWDVPAGMLVGLVGPNGAGKTTLLRLLPGLDRADGGKVRVFGLNPWKETVSVRTRLGFASEDQALFSLRIHRLLSHLSGYYPTWDPALVNDLVTRFEIDPGRHVRQLSRGETTRLRLVLALAFRPRLVVLDEPSAGLDLSGRRALLTSVREVVKDQGCSVIVSTHNLADVERISDRLLVLHKGEVIREGPTDALVPEGRTLEEALLEWRAV